MKKAILLSIVAGAIALPAYAENPSGPYVGGGFGQFNLEIDNLGDAGQSIIDVVKSDDSSWKVFAGWRLNPYLSLEAAYINLGDPNDRFSSAGSDGDYRVKMDGFSPNLIGTLPLGPIELFAKVGYYIYNVDIHTQLDNPGTNFVDSSHSRSDFVYGGGVGMTFLEHLHVRAEYEVFDLENYSDSNALWVSAAWRF